MEKEVLEAYERLVSAFREGRDKFGSFADEATTRRWAVVRLAG